MSHSQLQACGFILKQKFCLVILHPQCILNATPYYLRSPIASILPSKVKCFETQNLPWVYLDWFQQVHCNLMSSWKLKKKMRQERLEVWVPFPTLVITVLTLQKWATSQKLVWLLKAMSGSVTPYGKMGAQVFKMQEVDFARFINERKTDSS